MKQKKAWLKKAFFGVFLLGAMSAQAEDIDLYIGNDSTNPGKPNVLIVLDNTSNWARQSQKWPDGDAQGQSEVAAIQAALAKQVGKINVGVLEFTTEGTANQDGGYVRFDLQELTDDSFAVLTKQLEDISNGINTPIEKRNANTAYGNLMRDAYSYLSGGAQAYAGVGTPASLADGNGYATKYSLFESPINEDGLCNDINIIFVSNPNANGPANDSVENSNFLAGLYREVDGELNDKLAGFAFGTALPIELLTSTTKTDTTDLGFSTQCYAKQDIDVCTADESLSGGKCNGVESCACTAVQTTTVGCSKKNTSKYLVQSSETKTVVTETGKTDITSGAGWNFDDWAKFMHEYGVPIKYEADTGEILTTRVDVNVHTIDVFNAQQNAQHSGLMMSAAKTVGGGDYYAATNEEQIIESFNRALSNILSESSTFAAVALPLNTTNRAQNENQVFIGMFRPDKEAKPRWFGNLKEYQIGFDKNDKTTVSLVDVDGEPAVTSQTGFSDECAASFWTVDSENYWENLGVNPPPRGQCFTDKYSAYSHWSDLPDGPYVEKGGVAQILRNSDISERKLLSVSVSVSDSGSGDELTSFTSTFADISAELYAFITGSGLAVDEKGGKSEGRPSIHGDVIHSRPLPVNYGNDDQTVIYYGANDGLLRAVQVKTDKVTGKQEASELWALLAPEHMSKFERLYQNSPEVAFPGWLAEADEAAPEPKDYFFDGSIGQFVRYDSNNEVSQAWIYPVMRRGGRMVYALDVTDPNDPQLLWRVGCPLANSNDGCTDTDFEDLGQTWSTPKGFLTKSYTGADTVATDDVAGEPQPLIAFGGGYDSCEDTDSVLSTCTDADTGNLVFILDARTGKPVRTFKTDRAVSADLTPVDIDFDGYVDFLYAADNGGNIWRINLVEDDGTAFAPLAVAEWDITRSAYTAGFGRKFMSAPAVLPYLGKVYVALGSGNRERPLESNYPYEDDVDDRFYTYLDFPAETEALNLDGDTMNNSTAEPACEDDRILPGSLKRGWYMSLDGQGEQVVNPAVIAGGKVLFNSYQPGGAKTDLCTRPLGLGTAYNMSLFNGSACGSQRSELIDNGGMPIPPGLSTVTVTKPDCTGDNCEETVTICIGCKGLEPTEIEPIVDMTRRRVYWKSDIDR